MIAVHQRDDAVRCSLFVYRHNDIVLLEDIGRLGPFFDRLIPWPVLILGIWLRSDMSIKHRRGSEEPHLRFARELVIEEGVEQVHLVLFDFRDTVQHVPATSASTIGRRSPGRTSGQTRAEYR